MTHQNMSAFFVSACVVLHGYKLVLISPELSVNATLAWAPKNPAFSFPRELLLVRSTSREELHKQSSDRLRFGDDWMTSPSVSVADVEEYLLCSCARSAPRLRLLASLLEVGKSWMPLTLEISVSSRFAASVTDAGTLLEHFSASASMMDAFLLALV